MAEYYTMKIAGLERRLEKFPVNEKMGHRRIYNFRRCGADYCRLRGAAQKAARV